MTFVISKRVATSCSEAPAASSRANSHSIGASANRLVKTCVSGRVDWPVSVMCSSMAARLCRLRMAWPQAMPCSNHGRAPEGRGKASVVGAGVLAAALSSSNPAGSGAELRVPMAATPPSAALHPGHRRRPYRRWSPECHSEHRAIKHPDPDIEGTQFAAKTCAPGRARGARGGSQPGQGPVHVSSSAPS